MLTLLSVAQIWREEEKGGGEEDEGEEEDEEGEEEYKEDNDVSCYFWRLTSTIVVVPHR